MRVMVTGANRGIGLEYVRQLVNRGDEVFAACRQPESASNLNSLKAAGKLTVLELDVTDSASVQAAYNTVAKVTDRLDMLINNAAINPGDETLTSIDKANLMKTFEVNVAGVILVCQQFVNLLKAGDEPRIVNISSGAGSVAGGGSPKLYSYCISKTALNMFNCLLSQELKPHGIICTVQNPGWVQTDMGGANADLTPAASVRQQLQVIDGLTLADSGAFKNYTSETIPW